MFWGVWEFGVLSVGVRGLRVLGVSGLNFRLYRQSS